MACALAQPGDVSGSPGPEQEVEAENEDDAVVEVQSSTVGAADALGGIAPVVVSHAFIDALLGEQDELHRWLGAAVRQRLVSYCLIPAESFDFEMGVVLRQVFAAASSRQATLNEQDEADLAAIGEQRARQGVPVDDMLRAWRVATEAAVNYVRKLAQRDDVSESRALEFLECVLRWSDLALVVTTRAYRRAELALERAADERDVRFVRGTLLGTIPSVELRMKAEVYGLDPDGEYVAFRARIDDDTSRRQLEKAVGFHDPLCERRGLCADVDGEVVGFMTEAPPTDLDGIIGFGHPKPLEQLVESYRLATRALVTAQACGRRGTYDIVALGLRPAVAMDVDVGESLRRRYLEPLAAASSPGELMATLRAYLACGMHVERTATRLFVHQNTVRYRIARFEELTGADLGSTEVVLELWWALEFSAMRL
ncbi:PucR family transcriptional regulator [Mycobacterium marseillense]|uniref:PucR family transcriptional regulator n=1 Tax=Mycobacterium marseillense TaxID=701042 RepID=A0AAC9YJM6_9MYCO|nr:PucR family transcriptional regulator [Mycobacterium marseillense]